MPNFATAADALTTALATVDSRLTSIDISSQLELYLDLIGRRASIQAAIAASGGGSGAVTVAQLPSSLGAKTSANSLSIIKASDATDFIENGIAFTRPANVTPYPANSVYGTVIEVTGLGANNGGLLITDLNLLINIGIIPSGMGVFRVYLYSSAPAVTLTNTQTWARGADGAKLRRPDGIALRSVVVGKDGGILISQNTELQVSCKLSATGSLFLYVVTDTGFTPANNSETGTVEIKGLLT